MDSDEEVKRRVDPDDRYYFFVSRLSNICFEYLTKLTLVGVLHQLAEKIEDSTIKVVAVFFTMILSINILFGLMRVCNYFSDAIAARSELKLWKKLVLVLAITAPIILGYHFLLSPAIKEVISYYSQG